MPPIRRSYAMHDICESESESMPSYIFVSSSRLGQKFKQAYKDERIKEELPSDDIAPAVEQRPPALTLKDLEIIRTLGGGQEGQVFMARTKRTSHQFDRPGSIYALKALRKKHRRMVQDCDTHMYEKDIERTKLVALPWNPFIAGVVQAFDDPRNMYLMLELAPCGTLRSIMQQQAPLSAASAAFYFANIVCALEFLHAVGIVHRDVKPDNLLVGQDGYLCLTDFGSAAYAIDDSQPWRELGTPLYRAPELEFQIGIEIPGDDGEEEPTEEITTQKRCSLDWYSSGCILYEMITKKVPFYGRDVMSTWSKKFGGVQWLPGLKAGKNLKQLVECLLLVEPLERPVASEIRHSPWFSHVDWNIMMARQYLPPYVPDQCKMKELWHKQPMPKQREVPGLSVVDPPLHFVHDNRFPEKAYV